MEQSGLHSLSVSDNGNGRLDPAQTIKWSVANNSVESILFPAAKEEPTVIFQTKKTKRGTKAQKFRIWCFEITFQNEYED